MAKTERGRLLDVNEVAETLNLQPMSVYNGPLRTQLPWIVLGNGRLRLRPDDLDAYLQSHRQATAA